MGLANQSVDAKVSIGQISRTERKFSLYVVFLGIDFIIRFSCIPYLLF
jgi:hypothetical protein